MANKRLSHDGTVKRRQGHLLNKECRGMYYLERRGKFTNRSKKRAFTQNLSTDFSEATCENIVQSQQLCAIYNHFADQNRHSSF